MYVEFLRVYVEFLRRHKLCVDMSMNMSLCVNVLMYSRNVACIDGHDSGTFFLLDIMCDCREQSWNRNPKLNIAVVDLKSKIENQNLIY